jgi:hypothetical protein
VLDGDEARRLLNSIDTSSVGGLRDRALTRLGLAPRKGSVPKQVGGGLCDPDPDGFCEPHSRASRSGRMQRMDNTGHTLPELSASDRAGARGCEGRRWIEGAAEVRRSLGLQIPITPSAATVR